MRKKLVNLIIVLIAVIFAVVVISTLLYSLGIFSSSTTRVTVTGFAPFSFVAYECNSSGIYLELNNTPPTVFVAQNLVNYSDYHPVTFEMASINSSSNLIGSLTSSTFNPTYVEINETTILTLKGITCQTTGGYSIDISLEYSESTNPGTSYLSYGIINSTFS